MPQLPAKISFNAGEQGPLVDARFDLPRYRFGCRQIENFHLTQYGPLEFSPGTKYIGTGASKNKLYGYTYSETTGYLLEFGNTTPGGGYVQFYNQDGSIVSPSDSSTAWGNSINYKIGNIVLEAGAYYYCVVDHLSNAFLTDFVAGVWDTIKTLRILTPYSLTENFQLSIEPVNDIVYIAHGNVAFGKLVRSTATVWTYQAVAWTYPPMRADNLVSADLLACTVTALAASGNLNATGGHTPFVAAHVGSYWKIEHRQKGISRSLDISGSAGTVTTTSIKLKGSWSVDTTERWYGTLELQRSEDNITFVTIREWTSASSRNIATSGNQLTTAWLRLRYTATGNPYAAPVWAGTPPTDYVKAKAVLESQELYLGGVVKVTGYTSNIQLQVDVVVALESIAATDVWAEGAHSTHRGHAKNVILKDGGLVLAGNDEEPTRYWKSVGDDFENFEYGTDDDSAFRFNTTGVRNPIQWLLEVRGELLSGSTGELNAITAGQDLPLTPNSATIARNAANYGSARIPAININDVALFVQLGGKKIREFVYSFETDGYVSADLTRLAHHITEGGIVDIAFSENPNSTLYLIRADGQLLRLTYERQEGVVGWARRKTRTGDSYESVAVVPDGSGGSNVFLSVKRLLAGGSDRRTIELVQESDWYNDTDPNDISDAWYLDNATKTDLGSLSIAQIDFIQDPGTSLFGYGAGGPGSYKNGLWKVKTTAAHNLTTGDTIRVELVDSLLDTATWAAINGKVCCVIVIDADEFYFGDVNQTYTITGLLNTGAMPANLGTDAYSNTKVTVTSFGGFPRSGIIAGVTGMVEVNNLPFNFIQDVAGDTFLDGIDSAGYAAYAAGGKIYISPLLDVDYDSLSSVVASSAGNILKVSNTIPATGNSGESGLTAFSDGIPYEGLLGINSPPVVTLPTGVFSNKAIVGLPYTGLVETQKIDTVLSTGSSRGRIQSVHEIVLDLYRSFGGKAGTSADNLQEIHPRLFEDLMSDNQAALNNEHAIPIDGTPSPGKSIFIKQDLPLPMTIRALVPKINTASN